MSDNSAEFGIVTSGSSSSFLRVAAFKSSASKPIVGRTVVVDISLDDGDYRALGTVTDISTRNSTLENDNYAVAMSSERSGNFHGTDVRSFGLKIQSTFYRTDSESRWQKASSAFPTSPPTGTIVRMLTADDIPDLLADDDEIVHLGKMRGLSGTDSPNIVPNFSSQRGATHSGIVGRSGSGKTAFSSFLLASQFSHENHAIIVIDPQGQWANENGFLFSLQKFAASLGREVSVLRVAEDIQLPMKEEILGRLFDQVDLWGRGFQRMGAENKQAFSDEIATQIASRFYRKGGLKDADPRELLSSIFESLANSRGALKRIYASEDRIESLKRVLLLMAGITPVVKDNEGNEIEEVIEPDEWEDVENTWNRLLPRFIPLLNLFLPVNLQGGKRHPLGGHNGFLTGVMQVRGTNPEKPAPYVILDMSSDTTNKAKSEYAAGTGADDNAAVLAQMRVILDNADIKALIVSMVLDEIKSSSEEAFADGGGNLNTQVVFDEAWRYAPNITAGQQDTPIGALSAQLEGFALDTRKYGIGWTYILQSPSDLNRGIWRQLAFVYTGYGIIGADKKMLGDLMDEKERDAQMGLYDQFAPPSATGVYPFMINGPISPLIFTNTPVFIDAYNSVEEFITANKKWIDRIVARRNLTPVNPAFLGVEKARKKSAPLPAVTGSKSEGKASEAPATSDSREQAAFRVGGSPKTGASSVPQYVAPEAKSSKSSNDPSAGFDDIEPPPF